MISNIKQNENKICRMTAISESDKITVKDLSAINIISLEFKNTVQQIEETKSANRTFEVSELKRREDYIKMKVQSGIILIVFKNIYIHILSFEMIR